MKPDRAQRSARNRFESLVVSAWYDPNAHALLRSLFFVFGKPLSWLTRQISRRARKRIHQTKSTNPPTPPVLVVGNLIAGGSGKTPLTIAITNELIARGVRVGVICKGDGAAHPVQSPQIVGESSSAKSVGDEAMLLFQSTTATVCVGVRRNDARLALLEQQPGTELIISDDGLQHQALPRTLELAVFDRRAAGNGRLLPAGPLREPVSHLGLMDALILNLGIDPHSESDPDNEVRRLHKQGISHPVTFCSEMSVRDIVPLEQFAISRADATSCKTPTAVSLAGKQLAAVAGIANPMQFFSQLQRLGLRVRPIILADHAAITPELLREIEEPFILITAKDAVKCPPDPRVFVLRVDANPPAELIDWITRKLDGLPAA